MAHYSQAKKQWRRVLERWCIREKSTAAITLTDRLSKGERLFRAPQGLHIIVHVASTMLYGEYVMDTEDYLVVGLIKEGRSAAFAGWEAITLIELH